MPVFIQLTPLYGDEIWINANKITSIQRWDYGGSKATEIQTDCATYKVQEEPAEIYAKFVDRFRHTGMYWRDEA